MAKKYELQIVVTSKDKASGVLAKITGGLKDLGLASLGIRAVKDAISGVADAMFDAVKGAASFQGISEAFEGIARSANRAGPDILDLFKKNSAGMISNRDAMLAYNKAAQLVSTDFANTLPDAMGMLAKVASATGQDIGFLTNSLVTGIGRTSPLILDNLGITVDLSEAYETYAKSIGKTVDSLTKEEQQTALTAQVMERLAENTKNLPDIAGQADTKMAALGATFQDLKDKVGMFLLPAFQSILDVATTVLDGVMNKWDVFSQAISSGMSIWDALRVTFTNLTGVIDFLEIAWTNISNVFNSVVLPAFREIVRVVGEVIGKVKEWIDKHPEFVTTILLIGGVLLGLSVAASAAAAAFGVLKAGIAFLLSPMVLLIGLITAGIAFLSDQEGGLSGALSRAAETARQLAAIIGVVLAAAFYFVYGIIQSVGNWISTQLIPFFQRLWANIMIVATAVVGALGAAWQWFLDSIITPVVNFIRDVLIPIFQGIWSAIQPALQDLFDGIKQILEGIQNDIIQPVINFINDVFVPIFDSIRAPIEEALGALKSAFEQVFGAIMSVIQPILGVIGAIPGAVQSAADSVKGIASTLGDLGLAGALPTIVPNMNLNSANSALSAGAGAVTGAIAGKDAGGRGFPGATYAIRPAVKTEYFTPDSAGDFTPEDQLGGNSIVINFNGTGGPSNQQEADNQGEMLVSALRAQGVRV
jgi:phage-related protein